MSAYILGRPLRAIPLLLGLSLIIFALVHAAPGGPFTVYLSNPNVTPEDIARLERNLGLDRPLPVQYLSWLLAFVRGDWGYSYVDGRAVLERILERAPATLELMGGAFLLALGVALVLGIAAALSPGKWADRLISAGSTAGISLPTFWLGLIFQLVFAVELRFCPTAGRMAPSGGGGLLYLVLPVTTLGSFYAASWLRYVRASLTGDGAENALSIHSRQGAWCFELGLCAYRKTFASTRINGVPSLRSAPGARRYRPS